MKSIIYIISICISLPLFSQWKTVKGEYKHNFNPFTQFDIDPYTNNMWLVNYYNAAVIENDGAVTSFGENELGQRWSGDKLNFGFTQGHTFFTKQLTGLFLFDNYQKQLLYSDNNFNKIYSDIDTLFLTRGNDKIIKYSYGISSENTAISGKQCLLKMENYMSMLVNMLL